MCNSKLSISGLFVWLEVAMAAMLCELLGLALASGPECSSLRRHVREMVCGARVNLDLAARRRHTEWNEHNKAGERARERDGEEGVSDSSGGGMWLCFYDLHLFLLTVSLSDGIHGIHAWRRAHISLIGCAQVLWVASWYPAKIECEMLHFPSCSAKLCLREIWKSHYVTCLTWPHKLWNLFVKLGSNHKELLSGFGCINLQRIYMCTESLAVYQPWFKVYLQAAHNLATYKVTDLLYWKSPDSACSRCLLTVCSSLSSED